MCMCACLQPMSKSTTAVTERSGLERCHYRGENVSRGIIGTNRYEASSTFEIFPRIIILFLYFQSACIGGLPRGVKWTYITSGDIDIVLVATKSGGQSLVVCIVN